MLLCLNIGARNALDTLQICNGVDITWRYYRLVTGIGNISRDAHIFRS